MSKSPLKTTLREGQKYLDQPVYVQVSKALPLALSINNINFAAGRYVFGEVGHQQPPSGQRLLVMASIDAFSHYERTRLRWVEPDGNGGLRPKQ